jgi:hypothetical protein
MYREGIDLPLDLDLRGLMRSGIIKIVESATSGTGQRAVLGELQLDLGPSDMSTTVSMEIIFDVDANGFLNVSAEDKQSGKTFNKKLVEVIDPFDPGTRLDPEFAIGFSGEDMARARAQADELLTRVHEAEKFLGGNIPPEILSKIVGGRDALQRAMQSRDPIELGGSLAAFCKAVNMKLPARSIAPTFSATPVELSATSALRSIFISYAREDGDWLERIRVHLLQLERLGHVEIWHDGKMMSGVPWQEEIKKALNKATAAVLLVTANFMASKFIYDHELPPILERNRAHGLSIIPVFIGHVYYERDPVLSYLNAFNDPRVPLKAMSEAEVEAQLARLVKELWSCLDRSNLH